MALHPLPDFARALPVIQVLDCLHRADANLNDASLAIRCALAAPLMATPPPGVTFAGLDGLLRQLHQLHIVINGTVDNLETTIESIAPIPRAEPAQ